MTDRCNDEQAPATADGQRLRSEFAGDPDMAEIVELFVGEMPDRIHALRHSADNADTDRLKTLAHQLKGAAGGYGFPTLGLAAADLESAVISAEPIDTIRGHVAQLVEMCKRVAA